MRLRNTFVQFNTQARLRWWNHVPCFPLDRALHQLGLEPTPIQNTLLNQEVGTARRQLDVRGRFDWSCVKVWGHLGIVGFCHAGDLLGPDVKEKYGVKYLRGAWLLSDGDHATAIKWYARGYYYEAKRRGMLVETGLRKG